MKKCPQCHRTYSDDTFSFCLADGTLLSAPYDPNATLIIPSPIVSKPDRTAHIDDPVVAININQSYRPKMKSLELYNCTRGVWRVNKNRANKARCAFAVYRNVIEEVYEIREWLPAGSTDYTRQYDLSTLKNRYEFIGKVARGVVRAKYLGRRIPEPHGQNPIRYYNC